MAVWTPTLHVFQRSSVRHVALHSALRLHLEINGGCSRVHTGALIRAPTIARMIVFTGAVEVVSVIVSRLGSRAELHIQPPPAQRRIRYLR